MPYSNFSKEKSSSKKQRIGDDFTDSLCFAVIGHKEPTPLLIAGGRYKPFNYRDYNPRGYKRTVKDIMRTYKKTATIHY